MVISVQRRRRTNVPFLAAPVYTIYASPTGSATGDGTAEDPKDYVSGLDSVMPGGVLRLLSGTYPGLTTRRDGESGKPITIEPADGAAVVVDGTSTISHDYHTINGKYRMEFFDSTFTDRSAETIQGMDGIDVQADYARIINIRLHDFKNGILAGAANLETLLYGNHLQYCGFQSINGHTVYMQNAGPTWKKFINNILEHSLGYGLHLWGASGAINNMWVEKNILVGSGEAGLGALPNVQMSGQADSAGHRLFENVSYGGEQNRIGYGSGNTVTDAEVWDNHFSTSTALRLVECIPDRMDGNDFYGSVDGFVSGDWPDNTYGLMNAIPDNAYLQTNIYEPGWATLAIFNHQAQAASVTVDVSGLYGAGDVLHLYNAQDWADVLTVTVAEVGTISVDMQAASHTVATPQGMTAPAKTFPDFGAFVIERIP